MVHLVQRYASSNDTTHIWTAYQEGITGPAKSPMPFILTSDQVILPVAMKAQLSWLILLCICSVYNVIIASI